MTKNLVYILFLCFSGTFTSDAQETPKALPKIQEAISDTLPNGLHYIIHPTKSKNIELRLVINAGSLQEKNSEKGYAHFLEHMVFNGSRDFPNWTAIDTLTSLGYRFGRDINAYTTYERTVYQLSLVSQEQVTLGLNILANFLNHATLDNDAINKEKKIVIQEINDYGGEDSVSRKKLEGTKHYDRLPIASVEDINAINSETLKAFYHEWYTPSLATVIIVGDVNQEKAEEEIKRLFSLREENKPYHRQQNIASFSPHFNENFQTKSGKTATNTLEIIRFTPTALLRNQHELKLHITEQLYKIFLSKKLKEGNSDAAYHSLWYLSNRNENALILKATNERELNSHVKRLSSILQTIAQKGISIEELNNSITQFLKNNKKEFSEEAIEYVANSYVDQAAGFHFYIPEKTKQNLAQTLVHDITTNDLEALHNKIWFTTDDVLYVLEQNPLVFQVKNSRKLSRSWKKGLKQKASFSTVQNTNVDTIKVKDFTWKTLPAIPIDGDSISIQHEIFHPSINVTELTLSNGLKVAIKPTDGQDNQLALSYISPNGLNLCAISDLPYYEDASYFIDSAWIKGLNDDEYLDWIIDKNISALTNLGQHGTLLSAVSRENSLDDLFQLSYRKLFQYTLPLNDFNEYIEDQINNLSATQDQSSILMLPSIQLQHKIEEYKQGKTTPTTSLSTVTDLKKVNIHAMFSLYDTIVRDYKENKMIITGPITVKEVKAKLMEYFATVPRGITDSKLNIQPQDLQKQKKVKFAIEDDGTHRPETTIVYKGELKRELKEAIIAHMVVEIFNHEFLIKSREEEGLVYSPGTALDLIFSPDVASYISLHFTSTKEDIEKLELLANNVITSILKNHLDQQLIERLKRAIALNKSRHLTDNATTNWMEKLREQYSNYNQLEDFDNYDTLLASITADDIQKVAKRMFSFENYGLFTLE